MKVTLSVIKADIGGYVGHSESHPDIIAKAGECLAKAKKEGLLIDCQATKRGDDLQLIMTHQKGTGNYEIHKLAWDTFVTGTELAKSMKLYGAGQDLLADAFSGTVKGMGPGIAEMEFEERPSEPVLIFMADKTSAGAWNMPLYKMFADPFNTIGLVIAANRHNGFTSEVRDVKNKKKIVAGKQENVCVTPTVEMHKGTTGTSRNRSLFVSKSFKLEDRLVNDCVEGVLRALHIPFQTGEDYVSGNIPESVKYQISACDIFLSIWVHDRVGQKVIPSRARTYLIAETAYAEGLGKPVILVVQKGISQLGLFGYDTRRIDFALTPSNVLTKSIIELLAALMFHSLV